MRRFADTPIWFRLTAAIWLMLVLAWGGMIAWETRVSRDMAIVMGGTPLGAPFIGWVGDVYGPRWTIWVGSIATGLTFLGVSLWFMRNRGVRVHLRNGFRRNQEWGVDVWTVDEARAAVASSEGEPV